MKGNIIPIFLLQKKVKARLIHNIIIMQGSKIREEDRRDKILVNIQEKSALFLNRTHSCYVPRNANVHYLRTHIVGRSNSKESVFLFAYGIILNNSDQIQHLYSRFKSRIRQQVGLEIQVASMSSF